jgi:hypothetical protein
VPWDTGVAGVWVKIERKQEKLGNKKIAEIHDHKITVKIRGSLLHKVVLCYKLIPVCNA